MADVDRYTYAYSCLKDAARTYDSIPQNQQHKFPELAAQVAIGHFLKMLVDQQVRFDGTGNVTRK